MRLRVAILALVALAAGCRRAPPGVIDPTLASCVPADTLVLGGVDCERLRAAPVYAKLPAAVTALAQTLGPAKGLLVAWNGKDLLVVGRGAFGSQAPAGATLISSNLAAAGSPDAIRAAAAQHRRGSVASPLVARAEALAAGHEIWIVASGSATLPFSGNAENLNRLLHTTGFATLTVHATGGLDAEATGICATADRARQLEEEMRAFVSLAAAGEARRPEIAAELRSIQVNREEQTVHMTLHADAAGVGQWLRLF